MDYKTIKEEKEPFEIKSQDTTVSLDSILDKFLFYYSTNDIKNIFQGISELNRYLHEYKVDINKINDYKINEVFYSLLMNDNFSAYYDNIIRTLKAFITRTQDFDITPFEDINFFHRIIFDIGQYLRHPSERIFLLASILDKSRAPRAKYLNPDIISNILEISSTDESIKRAIFSFFASAIIILDDFLKDYISQITAFFSAVLMEKINSAKLFYDHLETLIQRVPYEYINHCLIDSLDFTALLEQCKDSDKIDQIATLRIVLLLLEIENQKIRSQIDLDHLAYIFNKETSSEEEEEESEDKLNETVNILFFKIGSKIIKQSFFKPSFNKYINELLKFSLNCVEEANFKIKKSAIAFLAQLIPLSPFVLHDLLEMNYISILSQYIECTGNIIKNFVIKSFLYILHSLTPDDEEMAFSIMEEEEIAAKINEIEINKKMELIDETELDIYNSIIEFNILYHELTKKIQTVYVE